MPSVVFAFQRADGKIAMEQRPLSDSYFPGEWVIPGGKIDPGEPIAYALLREIGEELSVTPEAIYQLDGETIYYKRHHPNFIVHPYLITEWHGEIPDHILDTGHPVDWYSLGHIILSPIECTREIASRIYAHNQRWVRKPRT